jgi:hypothetical protein
MVTQAASERRDRCELIASDMDKDTPIYCADGTRLGRLDRLMIDQPTGEVVYAVMRCEAPAGGRATHYPLPWSLIASRRRQDGYEADVTADELKGAPKFCSDESWDWSSRERGQFVHDYYNVPPYWGM